MNPSPPYVTRGGAVLSWFDGRMDVITKRLNRFEHLHLNAAPCLDRFYGTRLKFMKFVARLSVRHREAYEEHHHLYDQNA